MKTSIDALILVLAESERITKTALSTLSREVLEYINIEGSTDVDTINRLLSILTPMNKQAAALYFECFILYVYDADLFLFGEKIKNEKRYNAKVAATVAWLADIDNDIWAWSNDNIEVKAKDYAGDIQKAIKAALKGNEKKNYAPLSAAEVLATVVGTDGITPADLIMFFNSMVEAGEQTLAQAA